VPLPSSTSASASSPLQLLPSGRPQAASGHAATAEPPPARQGSPKESSSDEQGGEGLEGADRDEGESGGSGKRKRKRTSPEQLHLLETTFNAEQHPSLGMRNQLAAQLNMTPRSVQIW
jgi:homeobox protein YOX1/YHP1